MEYHCCMSDEVTMNDDPVLQTNGDFIDDYVSMTLLEGKASL